MSATADARETCENIGPGQYLVTRSFVAGGQPWCHEMIVCNPAYAYKQLDEWQECVLSRIAALDAKRHKRAA